MTESNREPISLMDIIPRSDGPLIDKLRDAKTWQYRFAAVDRFLVRGLAESRRNIPCELRWAWRTLEASRGQTSTRALAAAVGWSQRHLINQFRTYIGVAPNLTARRLRFSHALELVLSRPGGDLATIAGHAGFSDQSHMTGEFRTFSGFTPSAVRAERFDDLPGIPASVLSR